MKTTIPAGEFKAKCLKLMDLVNERQIEMTITKHGKAVAKLVPAERHKSPRQIYGALADRTVILGDLEAPLDIKWDAAES